MKRVKVISDDESDKSSDEEGNRERVAHELFEDEDEEMVETGPAPKESYRAISESEGEESGTISFVIKR